MLSFLVISTLDNDLAGGIFNIQKLGDSPEVVNINEYYKMFAMSAQEICRLFFLSTPDTDRRYKLHFRGRGGIRWERITALMSNRRAERECPGPVRRIF